MSLSDRQRMWLDAPYAERDKAKAHGARWDARLRVWYAPTYADELTPWLPAFSLIPGESRDEPLPEFPWVQPETTLQERMGSGSYQRLRNAVCARVDYRCERCQNTMRLPVEFAEHYRTTAKGNLSLDRLVCLCDRCFCKMVQTEIEPEDAYVKVKTGIVRRLGFRVKSNAEIRLDDIESWAEWYHPGSDMF